MQEFRYSLYVMRKSALLIAGLVVMVLFVGAASPGLSLVPYPAYGLSLSVNHVAPAQGTLDTEPASPTNATSSSWVNVSYAMLADSWYASSSHLGDTLFLAGFRPQLRFMAATVTALKVGVKYYGFGMFSTSVADVPSLAVSWNGGQNWSQEAEAPVKTWDNGTFSYLDFTNAHAWDAQQINRSGVLVRITHVAGPGTTKGTLLVDAALMQVTFQAIQNPPNGTNAAQGLTTLFLALGIVVAVVLSFVLLLGIRKPRKPKPASSSAPASPPPVGQPRKSALTGTDQPEPRPVQPQLAWRRRRVLIVGVTATVVVLLVVVAVVFFPEWVPGLVVVHLSADVIPRGGILIQGEADIHVDSASPVLGFERYRVNVGEGTINGTSEPFLPVCGCALVYVGTNEYSVTMLDVDHSSTLSAGDKFTVLLSTGRVPPIGTPMRFWLLLSNNWTVAYVTWNAM